MALRANAYRIALLILILNPRESKLFPIVCRCRLEAWRAAAARCWLIRRPMIDRKPAIVNSSVKWHRLLRTSRVPSQSSQQAHGDSAIDMHTIGCAALRCRSRWSHVRPRYAEPSTEHCLTWQGVNFVVHLGFVYGLAAEAGDCGFHLCHWVLTPHTAKLSFFESAVL